MDKSESRRRLLSNDFNDIWRADSEGFSSGYDSACESPMREVRRVNSKARDSFKQGEVMNFRNTNALCDHLKYILTMPELCDVTFLVGPNKVPIYGVKAILGTRSRVLYQLILNRQHDFELSRNSKSSTKRKNPSKVLVNVKKYEPEDFQKIIQFVHCGSVDITITNVTGLLCGAYQFGLDDLRSACWDFIQRNIAHDADSFSTIVLLDKARQYSHHKAGNRLMSKICEYMKQKTFKMRQTKNEDSEKSESDFRPRSGSITTTV